MRSTRRWPVQVHPVNAINMTDWMNDWALCASIETAPLDAARRRYMIAAERLNGRLAAEKSFAEQQVIERDSVHFLFSFWFQYSNPFQKAPLMFGLNLVFFSKLDRSTPCGERASRMVAVSRERWTALASAHNDAVSTVASRPRSQVYRRRTPCARIYAYMRARGLQIVSQNLNEFSSSFIWPIT